MVNVLILITTLFLGCSISAFAAIPLVEYQFENDGLDSSGANNHGTLVGTYSFDASGHTGSALSLSGSGYMTLPDNLILNNQDFTVAFWFKTTSYGGMFGYQNQPATSIGTASEYVPILSITNTGLLHAELWTNARGLVIRSTVPVNDGNWHSVALTGNTSQNTINVYLDATLLGTATTSVQHLSMSYSQLGLNRGSGRSGLQSTDYFNGLIDEFFFYAEAVPQTPNTAPVASAQLVSTNEDAALSITLSGTDTDNDAITYTLVSQPANGSLSGVAPSLTYTPTSNFNGTDSFAFKVNDGTEDSVNADVTITVNSVNDVPVATTQTISTDEDLAVAVTLAASDTESDSLTFSIVSSPVNGAISGTAPNLTYTPESGFFGSDSFTYKANDGTADSSAATVTITVIEVNEPPTAGDNDALVPANRFVDLAVLANDSDVESATLTIQSMSSASNGLATLLDAQTIRYTPNADYVGSDTLTYTVVDGGGATDTATITLTVIQPPAITFPGDITVDATGLFTFVDVGSPTAIDYQGQPLEVSLIEGETGPFQPGEHLLVWQATDTNGFITEETQYIRVRPLISFSKAQMVSEGNSVTVKVILNGPSPAYPVVVPFTVGGNATSPEDHNLVAGNAIITEGTETSIQVNIAEDEIAESDETIDLSMADDTLNYGAQHEHTITISEKNIAPNVSLNAAQAAFTRFTVSKTEGNVVITSTVSDPNSNEQHTYDWSVSNNMLIDLDEEIGTFTFDPSELAAGVYEIEADVSDNGTPALSNVARVFLRVVESLPTLSSDDTDEDGINDSDEGFADTDRDGIADYLDNIADCNVLPENVAVSDGFLLETDPGICMRLGNFSIAGETGGARLTSSDFSENSVDTLVPDSFSTNVGGYFDFILTQLPNDAQSVSVAVPLLSAIPANATYRKLANGTWQTFIEDANNQIASAAGETGYCPPPGSSEYTPGLNQGHWCLQLTIEDGGPNDADGKINRMIVDPGGIAVLETTEVSLSTKGGGAIGLWQFVMLLMVFFAKSSSSIRNKCVFIILSLCSTTAVAADQTGLNPESSKSWMPTKFYLWVDAGFGKGSSNKNDITEDFVDASTSISVNKFDITRNVGQIGVGVSVLPGWMVELGYVDLGEVELSGTGTVTTEELQQFYTTAEEIHPLSGDGFSAILQYQGKITQGFGYLVRGGLWHWEGNFSSFNGAKIGGDEVDGEDVVFSTGLTTSFGNQTDGRLLLQQYAIDGEKIRTLTAGLIYKF